MSEAISQRRYLIPFKAPRLPQRFTDVLVIGGGVAGLRAAIAASDEGADVLVLTKDTIDESNTWYAQGGIAAVLQPTDSFESHVQRHRNRCGAGLCDRIAPVKIVIEEGPQRVLELLQVGRQLRQENRPTRYDLDFTMRRGALASPGFIHAYGDATGNGTGAIR